MGLASFEFRISCEKHFVFQLFTAKQSRRNRDCTDIVKLGRGEGEKEGLVVPADLLRWALRPFLLLPCTVFDSFSLFFSFMFSVFMFLCSSSYCCSAYSLSFFLSFFLSLSLSPPPPECTQNCEFIERLGRNQPVDEDNETQSPGSADPSPPPPRSSAASLDALSKTSTDRPGKRQGSGTTTREDWVVSCGLFCGHLSITKDSERCQKRCLLRMKSLGRPEYPAVEY